MKGSNEKKKYSKEIQNKLIGVFDQIFERIHKQYPYIFIQKYSQKLAPKTNAFEQKLRKKKHE